MSGLIQLSKLLGCPFTSLDDWLVRVTSADMSAKQDQLDPQSHSHSQSASAHSDHNQDQSAPAQLNGQATPNAGASSQTNDKAMLQSSMAPQHSQQTQVEQQTGINGLLTAPSSQLQSHRLASLAAFAAAAAEQVSKACTATNTLQF